MAASRPKKKIGATHHHDVCMDVGHDGLLVVKNFLPREEAQRAHELLKSFSEEAWNPSTQKVDAQKKERGAGSTAHSYHVGDGGGAEGEVAHARNGEVTALLAKVSELGKSFFSGRDGLALVPKLQLARSGRGDFIEPHDDNGVTWIDGREHFRVLALVFYLTGEETWDPVIHGGCFLDRAKRPPRPVAPTHNTLIAFEVPRMHEVQPLTSDRPRFSVFGWLHAPVPGSRKRPGQDETGNTTKSKKRRKKKKKGGSKKPV